MITFSRVPSGNIVPWRTRRLKAGLPIPSGVTRPGGCPAIRLTDLVRDGRAEGHDPVRGEPFLANPVRVKYVEHGDEPDRFLKPKGGVAVPGGIVTIEPHLKSDGDVPRAKVLPQSTTAIGAASVKRDIVVWNGSREHQLYRDGPYDSITVNRPLERVIAELNHVGVQEFVSTRASRPRVEVTDGPCG